MSVFSVTIRTDPYKFAELPRLSRVTDRLPDITENRMVSRFGFEKNCPACYFYADAVTLNFGDDYSVLFLELDRIGAFFDFTSERIFEDKNGALAVL